MLQIAHRLGGKGLHKLSPAWSRLALKSAQADERLYSRESVAGRDRRSRTQRSEYSVHF
jgi:hypothetical protein